MRYLALAYHDVIGEGGTTLSGFNDAGAATYKLSLGRFHEHVRALENCRNATRFQILFTFDDGGVSALDAAAILEQAGYRGSFFVTTARIGTAGFLTASEIATLHRRGHTIGSHGVTHRGRMSRMTDALLSREWCDSVQTLASITGEPILSASVPSGFYAPRVARAAAQAGIRRLFTQQPTTHLSQAYGCEVLGRFTMRSWTPAARVSALAHGAARPLFEEALWYRLRSLAKAMPGNAYRDLRKVFYERRSPEGSL